MTGSANVFRRVGYCDEDLQSLGYAAKLLKRKASQLLGENDFQLDVVACSISVNYA